MAADTRMIFVAKSGGAARAMRINSHDARRWLGYLPERVKPRTVDVGWMCLSTVVICSHAEAMIANDRALAAEQCAAFEQIAEHLAWMDGVEYYTSWVIVETADID